MAPLSSCYFFCIFGSMCLIVTYYIMRTNKTIIILLFGLMVLPGHNRTYGQNDPNMALTYNILAGGGIGSITERLAIVDINDPLVLLRADEMDKGYDLEYNTKLWFVGFEWAATNGMRFSLIYTRHQGEYDAGASECYTDEDLFLLDESRIQGLCVNSFRFYLGPTIWSGRRFSIPIQGGIGFDKVSSDFMKNTTFNLSYIVKPTFYITNKIALYVGVSGSFGTQELSSVSNQAPNKPDNLHQYQYELHFEAGLTFSFYTK